MADYGTYASVTDLKGSLKIIDTTDDAELLRLLGMASRAIDRHCNRWFYAKTDTRYPQAMGGVYLNTGADLLSVTTLKMDADRDATFEYTMAATDYVLYPYSDQDFPKLQVELDTRQGDYTYWPRGLKSVEIAGVWGYGDGHRASPFDPLGITGTVATTAGTTLTVSATTGLEAGQNILIGTEQMYVTAIGTLQATVVRGINGTTAAIQAGAAISVAAYPEPVIEACMIEATRLWKRKDSAFAFAYGEAAIGMVQAGRGLDKDAAELLQTYIRWI
jgi:hypothetical protein